jgi:hypothetical protein
MIARSVTRPRLPEAFRSGPRAGPEGKGMTLSDQDFFFDEEPTPKADKPAPKGSGRPAASKGAAAKPAPAAAAAAPAPVSVFDSSVSMPIAGMLAVIGLLIGIIGGFLLGQSMAASTVASPDAAIPGAASTQQGATSGSMTGTGTNAPALTPQQMQQGQLPPGHPQVSGGTNTAPSNTTTP